MRRVDIFSPELSPESGDRSSIQYARVYARDRRALPVLTVWCVVLLAVLPLQAIAEDVTQKSLIRFNVPEQRADLALTQFAEQADITLLFPSDSLGEVVANELVGEFSVADGIDILLAETRLIPRFSNKLVLNIVFVSDSNNGETNMTNQEKSGKGFLATALGLLVALGAPAESSSAEEAGASKHTIDEIIVTATKRDKSLQDVPIAVTAFTTEDIAEQGIENFEDFSRQTPGVNLTGAKNFQKFTIRGIQTSSTSSSIGDQKPVAVYYDEVPVTSFSIVTPDLRLYDVERIEVLRGPQGTAFGSGSLSGAVRVITKKADPEGFDASARTDWGTTDGGGLRQRYSAMVNVPVSDSAAIRLAGYAREEEGYVDLVGSFGRPDIEDAVETSDWGIRGSMLWQPTENSSLTIFAMHDESDVTGGAEDQYPDLGKYKRRAKPTDMWIENDHLNLTYQHRFSWGELVSSTTFANQDHYWDLDLDAIFGDFMPFLYNETQSQDALVQEVRLVSSSDGDFDWLAGAFYLDRETDFLGSAYTSEEFLDSWGITYGDLPNMLSPGVETNSQFRAIRNQESALFGELTYRATDTISLMAGLRYTRFEFEDFQTAEGYTTDLFGLIFGFAGGNASATPATPIGLSTGQKSSVTARFNVMWQPDDDRTFYFTVAEGFRRPQPNVAALLPNLIDPNDPTVIPLVADSDELWNYELGVKLLLNGNLRANFAAYFIDWQDVQLTATRPSDSVPYSMNAGDAEAYGFEAELLYYPTAALELGLNLTLSRAEIVSMTQEQAIVSGMLEGSDLVTPDSQVSGFMQYTRPYSSANEMFGRLDFQYASEYPNAPPNVPGSPTQAPNAFFSHTDSYTNVNLQLGWQNESVRVVLYTENLLNSDDFIFINPANHTSNRFSTLRPRTTGLRLDWNFR